MLVRPRKFDFKTRHKSRKYQRPVTTWTLHYGQIGLKILHPSRLYSKQINRFKIFVAKGARRSTRSARRFWFAAFPHFPLTKKFKGARMGKGKSKLKDWVSRVSAGVNIIEYRNLHQGRATYFINQMRRKLNTETVLITKYRRANLFYSSKLKTSYVMFW